MTDKSHVPLDRMGPGNTEVFVETGGVAATVEVEREVTQTFRIPGSLGCRLKVHAVQAGRKEKDTLVHWNAGCPDHKGA